MSAGKRYLYLYILRDRFIVCNYKNDNTYFICDPLFNDIYTGGVKSIYNHNPKSA